jgi:hypothetical protein
MPIKKTPIPKRKPKQNNIVFASYPKKKVDRRYIDAFWKRYFNKKLEDATLKRKDRAMITTSKPDMIIFPLSPTVAVTIRNISYNSVSFNIKGIRFYSGKDYLELKKTIDKIIKENKLKFSEVVLADIIDYKIKDGNYYIMERIIPSITVNNFLYYLKYNTLNIFSNNRYNNSFIRTISKLDKEFLVKMHNNLNKALNELKQSPINIKKLDLNNNNTIIIDYNPNTEKFKFGLIDLIGSKSKSF